jgi:FtsX-like permease family protein/MacB-like protein
MQSLVRDIRYGLRSLLKSPGLTIVATLALTLGIGLTTTAFSIVYGAMLRGLRYPGGDRIVLITRANPARGIRNANLPIQDFVDYRAQQRSFSQLAAFTSGTIFVSGNEKAERFDGSRVSANLFDLVGVHPMLGRTFHEGEDTPTGDKVAILSYTMWHVFMIFGVVSLFLASVGLYAVMSFGVSRRTREVGIRMALGAQGRNVVAMIFGQALFQLGIGLTTGMVMALGISQLRRFILFQVQPRDPLIFSGVVLVLVVVGLIACFVPAKRATRVDPSSLFEAIDAALKSPHASAVRLALAGSEDVVFRWCPVANALLDTAEMGLMAVA